MRTTPTIAEEERLFDDNRNADDVLDYPDPDVVRVKVDVVDVKIDYSAWIDPDSRTETSFATL
jgi:hypothetical protein